MEQNSEIKHRIVETFADDVASVIEGDHTGLVKKIIHGEEEKEVLRQISSPESKRNKILMSMALVLMMLALTTWSFFLFRSDTSVVPLEKPFTPIIFTDKNVFLDVSDLSKDEVIKNILAEVHATSVKNGGLEAIYTDQNKQILGLRKFISLTQNNFIPGADTNLVSDNFLMGVVKSNEDVPDANNGFFILLKARSAQDIFSPLRAWENKMFLDLSPFFDTSLNSQNEYLLTKNFEDGIIGNKNARILYENNDTGDKKIALMYVFADDNSVIITSSIDAASEVMLRLASGKTNE